MERGKKGENEGSGKMDRRALEHNRMHASNSLKACPQVMTNQRLPLQTVNAAQAKRGGEGGPGMRALPARATFNVLCSACSGPLVPEPSARTALSPTKPQRNRRHQFGSVTFSRIAKQFTTNHNPTNPRLHDGFQRGN